jgi:dolichol kinase
MNLQNEIYRKYLHFLLILIPVGFLCLEKSVALIILVAISAFIVPLDFLRRKNSQMNLLFNNLFDPILREHEKKGDKLCGTSMVFISALLTFSFFRLDFAVTGFLILVISDGLAAIVGKAYPSRPFFEKSTFGALAFFVSAVVVLIACGIYFDARMSFYFFGFFAAMCLTIIESRPSLIGVDDGLTIPLFFVIEMSFFDIIWNFSY